MAVALLGDSRQTKNLTFPNEKWMIVTYNRYYKSEIILSCKIMLLYTDTTYLAMIHHYNEALVADYAKSPSC